MKSRFKRPWVGSFKPGRREQIPYDAPLQVDISKWHRFAVKWAHGHPQSGSISHDDLYDIAMSALVRSAQTWRPDGGSKFKSWVTTHIAYEIYEYNRRRKIRQKDTFWQEESLKQKNHEDVNEFDHEEAVFILENSKLTQREISVLRLRYIENQTLEDIGFQIGRSREMSRLIIMSARKKIQTAKEALNAREIAAHLDGRDDRTATMPGLSGSSRAG